MTAPTVHPDIADRIYGMRCGGAMVVEVHHETSWFVCPPPCGRHFVPVANLETAVRAELAARRPEAAGTPDAIARHVTHISVVGPDARDVVVHLVPRTPPAGLFSPGT